MDPLDPLSEIINTGQAFSFAILLEKIIWLFIGLFFLVSILKSLVNSINENEGFLLKTFLTIFRLFNLKRFFNRK